MKEVKTFVCLVDNYRRPLRKRNTSGRYLVGAKSAEEEKKLLQDALNLPDASIRGFCYRSSTQ